MKVFYFLSTRGLPMITLVKCQNSVLVLQSKTLMSTVDNQIDSKDTFFGIQGCRQGKLTCAGWIDILIPPLLLPTMQMHKSSLLK